MNCEFTPEEREQYSATFTLVGTAMWKYEESLDDREQLIVQRFLEGKLMMEMLVEFGISPVSIRRIFKRALAKAERFLNTTIQFEEKLYRLAHHPAVVGELVRTLIYVGEDAPAETVLRVHGVREEYAKVYPTWYKEDMSCFGFVAFLEHEDYEVLVEVNEEEDSHG